MHWDGWVPLVAGLHTKGEAAADTVVHTLGSSLRTRCCVHRSRVQVACRLLQAELVGSGGSGSGQRAVGNPV